MGIGRFVLTNGLPDNYPVKKFDPGVPKDCWLGLIRASSNSDWNAIWRYILYIDKICCYTSQLKSKANLKIKYDFKKSIWLHGGHNIAYTGRSKCAVRSCVYLHLQMPRHVFCWRYQSERAASRTYKVQFAAATARRRRRAGKGAPKTLIFAIYFKPKCEELLLDLTVW